MTCSLNKPEINYYNASMLVNTQFGRSLNNPDILFVSPNDNLYNFQTYAGTIKLNWKFYLTIN